jgi:glycogen operon protein
VDTLTLEPGRAWPLGATVDGDGVNVAVFSAHAQRIELCLFDGEREVARGALPERSGDVFHGRLPGARAGLVYGLRAHGPWRPDRGHRFNPHKLLLDPWAREIVPPAGGFAWHPALRGADAEHAAHMNAADSARWALKARVVDEAAPTWRRPRTPLAETVLYECHVRSFTKRLPGVPEHERGTYAGLASDAAIAHLGRLGITAVSLLPVHQHLDEARLVDMGLVNHWGYNTIGFFCPEPRYAATAAPRAEFRAMVERLHAAGIEVLIDVVYNHTAEGDERGATLAFRGLDCSSWYRLSPHDRARCENWTGCGNTVNLRHPRVLQFVLDSLRYWVQQMGVDGFRFDLAPVLGRESHAFDAGAAFFKTVAQDPALQGTKLVAEPWDIGPEGYQLGRFPRGWLEWNDKFRDTTRAFWLGGDCTRGELALRLAGSSDIYQAGGRSPLESVNYVCSHDGFNLADLVSYDLRRNEANGEDGRDGHAHNLSWNCGWEGPTRDPDVLARRARLKRALLATVLLAQGTPMLAAGDEIGHSQRGNNNPYCQDNPITWLDWANADDALVAYTARLVALRRRHLPLGLRWTTGIADGRGHADLTWLRRDGEPPSVEEWNNRSSRVLGALVGSAGRSGARLLILFNGRDIDMDFALPPGRWVAELDSTTSDGAGTWQRGDAGAYPLKSRSVVLLRDDDDPEGKPR